MERRVVTFDLFSALIDSRQGASAAFARLAEGRGWSASPTLVFDTWDRCNKGLHAQVTSWVPFARLAEEALAVTYRQLGLDGDPGRDAEELLSGVGAWPLWPDVASGLPGLARRYRIGLLSNVDDAVFARTRVADLVDPALAMTSERLGAYKPDPEIYRRADAAVGPIVHVASSARDVRGAMEAGIAMVRLRRPGHQLDPEGPTPTHQAGSVDELARLLDLAAVDRVGNE
ncbi:MAG: haloacid dehalogenase [Actinomycetes bacterium]